MTFLKEESTLVLADGWREVVRSSEIGFGPHINEACNAALAFCLSLAPSKGLGCDDNNLTTLHGHCKIYEGQKPPASMSGVTFGSVGDIIAVGQIAWSLAKALSDSRGSAKEYQGLVKELETFDKVLLQVSPGFCPKQKKKRSPMC